MHYRPPFSHRVTAHRVAHRAFGFGALPYSGFGLTQPLPNTPLEAFEQLETNIEGTKVEIANLNGQLTTAKSNLLNAKVVLLKCKSGRLSGFGHFGTASFKSEGVECPASGDWRAYCDCMYPKPSFYWNLCAASWPFPPWTLVGKTLPTALVSAVVVEVATVVSPAESTPEPSATPAAPDCTTQGNAVAALERMITVELPGKIAAANAKLTLLTAQVPGAQAEAQKQLDMEAAREAAQQTAQQQAAREQKKLLRQEKLQKTGNTALKVGGVAAAAFVLKMLLF